MLRALVSPNDASCSGGVRLTDFTFLPAARAREGVSWRAHRRGEGVPFREGGEVPLVALLRSRLVSRKITHRRLCWTVSSLGMGEDGCLTTVGRNWSLRGFMSLTRCESSLYHLCLNI